MRTEKHALQLIADGTLKINGNGEIWLMKSRGPRQRKVPRRAELHLTKGYLGIRIRINGRRYQVLAHRLVWTHFKGPIPNHLVINHKSGNKKNNRIRNLEIVTNSKNRFHAVKRGLWKPTFAKLTAMNVRKIKAGLKAGRLQKSLAKEFGTTTGNIGAIWRGKSWRWIK
jgi:hypothetical protein